MITGDANGRRMTVPSSALTARGSGEGVDKFHICVTAEPVVAAVDAPDAVLPHQRDQVGVGDIISARLVAARATEQLPESLGLARCTDVWPSEQGFGVGGRLTWSKRLGKDCGMGDDAQVPKHDRPEQVQEIGPAARR